MLTAWYQSKNGVQWTAVQFIKLSNCVVLRYIHYSKFNYTGSVGAHSPLSIFSTGQIHSDWSIAGQIHHRAHSSHYELPPRCPRPTAIPVADQITSLPSRVILNIMYTYLYVKNLDMLNFEEGYNASTTNASLLHCSIEGSWSLISGQWEWLQTVTGTQECLWSFKGTTTCHSVALRVAPLHV